MDGVSLAESLLYKDYDELQRLMKSCSVADSQNAILSHDSCNYSINDTEAMYHVSGNVFDTQNTEVHMSSFTANNKKQHECSEGVKSLLGDPLQKEFILESASFGLETVQNQRTLNNYTNRTQIQQYEELSAISKEYENMPMHGTPTEKQLSPESASSTSGAQQQTMISNFKLNAELPILTTTIPNHEVRMYPKFSNHSETKDTGNNSDTTSLRFCGAKANLDNYSPHHRTAGDKRAMNNLNTTTFQGRPFRVNSSCNHSEVISNISPSSSLIAECSSLMHCTNLISDNHHKKLLQQTDNTCAGLCEAKISFALPNEIASGSSQLKLDSLPWCNQSVYEKPSVRKGPVPLIPGVEKRNIPFLLPKPTHKLSTITDGPSKQMQQNTSSTRNSSKSQTFTKEFQYNTILPFSDFGVIQNPNPELSNEKQHLSAGSARLGQHLNSTTFMNPVERLVPSTSGDPSVKISGSVLPYEQMCEQHGYLINDIKKITSSLDPQFTKLGMPNATEKTTNHLADNHSGFENEIISLYNTYEKISNLINKLDKLRSGSVPKVVLSALEDLLGSIQKLPVKACNLGEARNLCERSSEENAVSLRVDWSTVSPILVELISHLRHMRTALWVCVQLFNWTGVSSYAQTVHRLAELSTRSSGTQSVSTTGLKLPQVPPLVNVVKPLKTVARPLMDLQSHVDGMRFSTGAAMTIAPANHTNNNNNAHNNTRSLLLLPGTANPTSLYWSQRNLFQSQARPIFTPTAQYFPDQVVIPDTSLFSNEPIGTVQSPGFLFPHPTAQSGQPALIMPTSLFTGSLNRNASFGPQLCNFPPATRFPERL